jgi:hypothetical protein
MIDAEGHDEVRIIGHSFPANPGMLWPLFASH